MEFKPRLEKLLGDVVLLSEVATLGEEAEVVVDHRPEETDAGSAFDGGGSADDAKTMVFNNVHFVSIGGDDQVMASPPTNHHHGSSSTTNLVDAIEQNDPPLEGPLLDTNTSMYNLPEQIPTNLSTPATVISSGDERQYHEMRRTVSGSLRMKSLLDRWEEPEIKNNKVRPFSSDQAIAHKY